MAEAQPYQQWLDEQLVQLDDDEKVEEEEVYGFTSSSKSVWIYV